MTVHISAINIAETETVMELTAMADKDYSLDALNRFFDFAATKGILKRNTAQSKKMAANKVLAVAEEKEKADLRKANIDAAFERFQNLQGTEYKPESLQVYLSRVRSAVAEFISYVDNPAGFKPYTTTRTRQKSTKNQKDRGTTPRTDEVSSPKSEPQDRGEHDQPHVIVPIPLREGLTLKISNIPADLTAAEANRIAAIIKAYAVIED